MPEDAVRLEQIVVTLARIETRLEVVMGGHADHETRIRRLEVGLDAGDARTTTIGVAQTDHEARIRRLEQAKWILVGFASLAGAAGGKIAGLL